jgi:uncharacterized glyoxalase superfamily protein PhnB
MPEIAYRGGMLMLGTAGVGELDSLLAVPGESRATQSIYVVTDDVVAIHDRILAAGADILIALRDEDYGGRSFTFRDPEGHVWSVGSYSPW